MSQEQLKAFIAKVQADTSLQEQLKAEGADVVAIAKAAGFAITTKDINAHRQGENCLMMSLKAWLEAPEPPTTRSLLAMSS